MTQPTATVIADSISSTAIRLLSFQITAHRFIIPQINTHRAFSRNYRSSRAVPTKNLINEVRTNPATPVFWGQNQSGMQARRELFGASLQAVEGSWLRAAAAAADEAEKMLGWGCHKQIVNRVLEPFLMTQAVITATELDNFFKLRLHDDAQPEIKALAEAMFAAMSASTPNLIKKGGWHMPYIDAEDLKQFNIKNQRDYLKTVPSLCKISVARCARVTYNVFNADRRSTLNDDIVLHDRLMASGHWSPFEHVAMNPDDLSSHTTLHQQGNFRGWWQYRRMFQQGCMP